MSVQQARNGCSRSPESVFTMTRIGVHDGRNRCSASAESAFTLKRNECSRWTGIRMSRAPGPAPAPQRFKNRTTFASLEKITVPTLLITGDADLYTPPPVLELFAKRIPRADTVLMREVGHSAYWEQPEAFNRAVLEFIKRH
ncbi:MAG: alpha/beta fold hydrolase [Acidobacteriota bacterium]